MRLHQHPSSQAVTPSPRHPLTPSPRAGARTPGRRGVILLVVLILLTMFALVAVTFVYMSDTEAKSADLYRGSEVKTRPDHDLLGAYFLSQLMHDTPNGASSMQTHGLASGLYGISGNTPFSGTGRLRFKTATVPVPYNVMPDPSGLINFSGRGYDEATYGALNAPYTYPDHNNAWLARLRADGAVLDRSFVRTVKLPTTANPFYIVFDPDRKSTRLNSSHRL